MFCVHQVLYIQAFVLVFLLGKFMRKVFFGQLRAAEMEVNSLFLIKVFCFFASPFHVFPISTLPFVFTSLSLVLLTHLAPDRAFLVCCD